jgi:hypothetical protein
MMRELTGFQVGRMVVTGPAGPEAGPLPAAPGGWWIGRCACGRQVISPAEGFLNRRVTSCGRPTAQDRAELQERLAALQPPPAL